MHIGILSYNLHEINDWHYWIILSLEKWSISYTPCGDAWRNFCYYLSKQIKDKIDKTYSCLSKYYSSESYVLFFSSWNLKSRIDLEKFLTTYDKDFTNCHLKPNDQTCLWQLYNNYKTFLDGAKRVSDIAPECFKTDVKAIN